MLAEGGTRADAAEVLNPGMATARRLGAEPLLAAMPALVTRARLPVEQQTPEAEAVAPSPFAPGLTTREEEVLRNVAACFTNR